MSRAHRPKLGQHFLSDARYRQRIAASLDLRPEEFVVEIGPGRGAMTSLLLERAQKVTAIEIDPALADGLRLKFPGESRLDILTSDILAADFSALCSRLGVGQCFVFGNLPYYITSPILHHLFQYTRWIRAMALLVQREVAERLTAIPGCRDYGYLTVLTQLYSEPRIALTVPPGAFTPPPKVQSALVHFRMAARFPAWTAEERTRFLDFVKHCFAHKRKNLLNNLAGIYSRLKVLRVLESLMLPATVRAEQLSLDQLSALFGKLAHRVH